MAGFDPSKGGSSPLAAAFLQNKATQPTAAPGGQMPLITQPVQAPMDFGSMAPRPMPQPVAPPVQQQRPQMPDFGSTGGGGGRWGPGGWAKEKQWSALQKAGLLKSPADLMSGRLQSMGHYGYRGGGQ